MRNLPAAYTHTHTHTILHTQSYSCTTQQKTHTNARIRIRTFSHSTSATFPCVLCWVISHTQAENVFFFKFRAGSTVLFARHCCCSTFWPVYWLEAAGENQTVVEGERVVYDGAVSQKRFSTPMYVATNIWCMVALLLVHVSCETFVQLSVKYRRTSHCAHMQTEFSVLLAGVGKWLPRFVALLCMQTYLARFLIV